METIYIGALPDNRSEEQKSKDWTGEELFGMGAVVWKEKKPEEWRSFPISNQDGSGMCAAFSVTKMLGINEFNENGKFEVLNKAYIYNKRSNNGSGMYMWQALELACKVGSPLDTERTSENINDEQASKITFTEEQVQEALKYRGSSFLYLGTNIDTIAGAIERGYGVGLLVGCHSSEYTNTPTVNPAYKRDDFNIWHFVVAVDYSLVNGEKCLIIEDSWGTNYGFNGRRVFTADFMKNRVTASGQIIDLVNKVTLKPTVSISRPLAFGAKGSDVVAVQKMLQYEKLLPTHTSKGEQLPLGSFLGMTANAVKKWQVKHGIMDFANENDMKKIRFGQKSINKSKELYGL